jgi:glycerol kinase
MSDVSDTNRTPGCRRVSSVPAAVSEQAGRRSGSNPKIGVTMRYILSLDQGTTSSRAIVFDRGGGIVAMAQREFPQLYPQPGWVEHDPQAIWISQRDVAIEAIARAGAGAGDIAAIGITNQRETTLVWDRSTSQPICNAIVWQDRRTADFCNGLRDQGLEPLIQQKTGLVIDPYFSGSKLRWILDNIPGARARAERGELAFGTVDSWLLWQLTGGRVHATDPTNAARTLLFNIHTSQWDEELLELLAIPRSLLPDIVPSSAIAGEATAVAELMGIPIAGIAGDQQAALFGQLCTQPGMAKNTYGTGCFLLLNTGPNAIASRHRLLTTAAADVGTSRTYALEGSVFIAGAVVQWLRDQLKIIARAGEIEALARQVPDSGGVVFVPALAGLGAPHWDPAARGTIVGLTRGTSAAHLARAALEAIAYQSADVLDAMQADAGERLRELRVDGGASRNDLLMQFQADILGVPTLRPTVAETTALGAAYLAGLGTGFWRSTDELQSHWQLDRRFEPSMDRAQAQRLRDRWHEALKRARDWVRFE